MRMLEKRKRSEEDDECCRRKSREDSPLQSQRAEENISLSKRPEPEQVNPIRQHSLA
jgi:hypothetical protein